MSRLFRSFLNWNIYASKAFNSLFPADMVRDGNNYFLTQTLPAALTVGAKVYDVGGGSQPCISLKTKAEMGLKLVGIDLSRDELDRAPSGIYDEKLVVDLCTYQGRGDADIIICQSTLEHTHNTAAAIQGIASILRQGGLVYIFVPCKNATFARLNRVLPQKLKERILFSFFPGIKDHQGFPAFYDSCTPRQMSKNLSDVGLEVENIQVFWMSSYFMVFFPLFFVWRMWQLIYRLLVSSEAAETFIIIARKRF